MVVPEETRRRLAEKLAALLPHLDERQQRLLMGAEARMLGHGGIRAVAQAAGTSETTVRRGMAELEAGDAPLGRVRRPGGGRRRAADVDPELRPALLAMVKPDMRADPMSPLSWTTRSTRKLAEELARQGRRVSAGTVADLLRAEGFTLHADTIDDRLHPHRDGQFRYINEQARRHLDAGQPVVSVDVRKSGLVSGYAGAGDHWRPPAPPAVRDGADGPSLRKLYDDPPNTRRVDAGTGHDTARFAVAVVRHWWRAHGLPDHRGAVRLLITVSIGRPDTDRTRFWKAELATFAAETGLDVTVCHLPPGTSKWSRIEDRLACHVTTNWRGRPLTSYDVIVNSIAATSTGTGLTIRAEFDADVYATGPPVADVQIDALRMTRHPFHGDWNYTLHPTARGPEPVGPAVEDA